jgi:hypothetical protein
MDHPLPVRAPPSSTSTGARTPSIAVPAGGSGSQQRTPAEGVAGDLSVATASSASASVPNPPLAVAEEVPIILASNALGGAGARVASSDPQDPPVTIEAAPSGPRVPAEGPEATLLPTAAECLAAGISSDAPSAVGVGGAPNSVPPPTPRSLEVILGRPLWSGTESEATLTPLPRLLSLAHQALRETEVAIRREWEALETERQRLGDWCTQLEERTKAVSCHFALERAEFEQEREDFKEDIWKVSDREDEVIQKEKSLARKEVRLEQREETVTALQAKLKAYITVLEKQRVKQAAAEVKLQKLQHELANRASDIARAKGSLKAGEASLAKRAAGLTRQEEDLTFREEMWAWRNKLLDELELEAEERRKRLEDKVRALEEQVRQFRAAQVAQATRTASAPQEVDAMRKILDDLRAEQRAGA